MTVVTSPHRAGAPLSTSPPQPSVKVLVTGGYAAGKTTFVRAVSDLPPVCTDVPLTGTRATGTPGAPGKADTTAAMDFGRTTIAGSVMVYLFATPGHTRFRPMIDALSTGVAAALVLVDTTRLDESFPVLDHLDTRGLPYLVAVNRWSSATGPGLHQVHHALQVPPWVPVLTCDAHDPRSATAVLTHLVGETLAGRIRPPRPRTAAPDAALPVGVTGCAPPGPPAPSTPTAGHRTPDGGIL